MSDEMTTNTSVCVTGASGFVAAHVIRELLERGYRVHSMRDVVELLEKAGYRDGYKLPRLDLAGSIGDFAVKLLSYTQPAGTGSYMRTHLGKVMRYDNAKIRRELGVQFGPVRESVVAAAEDLVRWGHLARTR